MEEGLAAVSSGHEQERSVTFGSTVGQPVVVEGSDGSAPVEHHGLLGDVAHPEVLRRINPW